MEIIVNSHIYYEPVLKPPVDIDLNQGPLNESRDESDDEQGDFYFQ